MRNNKIIYSHNVQDIQTVAKEALYRKLSDIEIKSILDSIAEKINWHFVIMDSIIENIKLADED